MKYLLLVYFNEQVLEKKNAAETEAFLKGYQRFNDELIAAGAMLSAERLQPTETSATVRVENGRMVATDGPFAETKEQLGGYYLIEALDRDEAFAWAAKIPHATEGHVEVRPVFETLRGDFGEQPS